jgi:phage terminase large subunit
MLSSAALAKKDRIVTGYTPRPLQFRLHSSLKRFNVIVCHRRFGKTVFSVNEMVDRALRCTQKNPQFAYIAPTYGQAERIAWDMLKTYTRDIPGVEYNQQKLTATIPRPQYGDRIKIFLLGAENPDSVRGMYLDGAILDEFAEMDPRIWGEVVRPALSDRGGWAIFIGTPRGQNHFYDVLQVALKNETGNWFSAIYKASTSGVLPPEELRDLRAEMSEEQFDQELECSFTAALVGAYYGKAIAEIEAKGQIGKVPHDPSLLVDTFWDLGVGDTTTIWFAQQYRQEVRIIDYVEMGGEGLPYYAKLLKEGERSAYNYRYHEWPHDGGSRDLSTGKTRNQTMRDLGVRVNVNKRQEVADGIDAVRRVLARCFFDAVKCERGINALKNYRRKWDAKNKIFLEQPLHDWSSHGADGFRTMAMVLRPGEDRSEYKKNLPRVADTNYDIFKV